MSNVGRNEPCPCGSGRKAKRCCGVARGPSEESLARAFVASASRAAAGRLHMYADAELAGLSEELWQLSGVDLSLQAELPKMFSTELQRLADALCDDDPEEEALDVVVEKLDTPLERARLAQAAVDLAAEGAIDEELAAVALLDLGSDSRMLLRAAVLEAVAGV